MLSFVPLYPRHIGRNVSGKMPLTRRRAKRGENRTRQCSSDLGNEVKHVTTGSAKAESSAPKRRKMEPLLRNDLLAKSAKFPFLNDEVIARTSAVEERSTDVRYGNDNKHTIPARVRITQEARALLDIEDLPPRAPLPQEADDVLQRLRKFYRGELSTASHPKTQTRRDLLDSLFSTILSQATSNTNSSRAFAALKSAFPTWEDAMNAGAESIEDQIRCGGLAKAKSKVMHSILRQLHEERGSCSLEFLRDMSTEQVKDTLCSFSGVGPKTASCVLMFGMQRGEFPVDTHIRRIAARLGWVAVASSAEKTYEVLNACLKDDIKYELHVLLIEHGRKVCRARSPRCDGCPLAKLCPSRAIST